MSRRAAATADEVLDCLLCGAAVEPFWHPQLQETVAYELCPRCAQAFAAAAERVASRVVAELAHNFADAHCGHPDSVGVFPEKGAVCPLCRPRTAGHQAAAEHVPGQLELDDAAPACDCGVQVLGLSGHTPGCSSLVRVCLCGHEEREHDQDLQDGPGEALEGQAPIVCRHCVCELFEATE